MPKKQSKSPGSIALLKPLLPEETKQIAIQRTMATVKQETLLKELSEKDIPEMFATNNLIPTDEVSDKLDKVSLASSLESGHALVESIPKRYRGFALLLRDELEQEYSCETASEKMLVQQIVNSHIRMLSYSKKMEERNEPEWLSHERAAFLNFYSRESDRAHRHTLSALETLKAIKQPGFNISVKANNAFIAQNQQLNNHSEQTNEAK